MYSHQLVKVFSIRIKALILKALRLTAAASTRDAAIQKKPFDHVQQHS